MFYKFIGKNESLGLQNGTIYCLQLEGRPNGQVHAKMGHWTCPYVDYAAFRANWEPMA